MPLLERLLLRGHIDQIKAVDQDIKAALDEHWTAQNVVLIVGAVGAVTRLIATRIQGKEQDPAVLVLDPKGTFVIPLLGSHSAGAEQRAREIAMDLGGQAVITGACAHEGRLPLDAFGEAWGWRRRGSVAGWRELMVRQAQGFSISVHQGGGCSAWQGRESQHLLETTAPEAADLVIGARLQGDCQWHPATLWIGIGCERNTSLSLVEKAIAEALATAGLAQEAVAGIASAERKSDEPALQQLSKTRAWPFRTFAEQTLASIDVPNPSEVVRREMGTASVSEAAALLAAGDKSVLIQPKQISRPTTGEQGAVTVAIAEAPIPHAPGRGELHLVGSGPGDLSLLSGDAKAALSRCCAWVGYSLYLDLLEPLRRQDQIRFDGQLTREWDRCAEALRLAQQGAKVALISSGDSGIYGMAGLALELLLQQPEQDRPSFLVHPGISAFQLAAARAGAPLMHDFCCVSLSDRLTPWTVIEKRLEAAAAGDFVLALYNPRSKGRDWQLGQAKQILLKRRPPTTPVMLARQLGRAEESLQITSLERLEPESVDMLTLVLIGNSSSRAEDGWMVTPRGYPGASLQ
ncbi:precorrin-3B C(17)-methyltransferase [Synechococcus sp. PROS-U-1]|uniref:precorrin-3B C(17)-methyltransferase n=1 Tax=Synechococcus sp. PROS-U-1 TaxID=1400866 RepID=UPI0016489E50|nr:precorrin-3B C(17)-methyltransferase [Synechococcus sp. PROS-U-1]